MVELAIEAWTEGSYEFLKPKDQPHEAGLLKLDISKAVNELGWKPKFNASKAVKFTIEWYKAFYNSKETIVQYTEEQINEFFNG